MGGEEERDLWAPQNPRFLESPLSSADAPRCAQAIILHPSFRRNRSVVLFWDSEDLFTAIVKVVVVVVVVVMAEAVVADGAIVRTHLSTFV